MIINIKVYHGTRKENLRGILKSGFDIDTISCATMDKKWASRYGEYLLVFKYPYQVTFSWLTIREDVEHLIMFVKDYIKKDVPVGVAGFKPKKLKLELSIYYMHHMKSRVMKDIDRKKEIKSVLLN